MRLPFVTLWTNIHPGCTRKDIIVQSKNPQTSWMVSWYSQQENGSVHVGGKKKKKENY